MMLIGACYGAVPTISASLAEEFFGPAHYGRSLGIVNLSILVGSFASTAAGAIQTPPAPTPRRSTSSSGSKPWPWC